MVSTIRACGIRLSLLSGCWDHFLKVKSGTQSWETEAVWRLTDDERRSAEWSAASAGSEILARIQLWDPGSSDCLEMHLESWESP